jgi:hypothetical protein
MIGYLHPKREVILVRTAGATAIVILFCLRYNVNLIVGEPALRGGDEDGRRRAACGCS